MSDLHVIVGLGATGLSCAQYLNGKNIPVAVTDTRSNPPQLAALQQSCPGITFALGGLDVSLLNKASCIVLSPGLSCHDPLILDQIKRGVPVVGDIELFAQAVRSPVIAITGTNAKSTVTTLVGKMAQQAGLNVEVGGNLGVPALDLLKNPADLYVLELSSFQLETTFSLKPKVSTILNITPDHMDRYKTLAEYQQAKQRVYQHCQVAVCNYDDQLTECSHQSKFYFTLQKPTDNQFGLLESNGKNYLAFGDQPLLNVAELPVKGKHYQMNALASLAIGHGFGLPFAPMLQVLREFTGLPHRCEFVREIEQVSWYNDSKGTNVGATLAAIEGLGGDINGKLVLIAGGIGKKADFTPLVAAIEKYARHVVLIGEAANELATVIAKRVPVTFANSMEEAVMQAKEHACKNDSVLLSPACASFDMFKNFEHRGDVFMEIVRRV